MTISEKEVQEFFQISIVKYIQHKFDSLINFNKEEK